MFCGGKTVIFLVDAILKATTTANLRVVDLVTPRKAFLSAGQGGHVTFIVIYYVKPCRSRFFALFLRMKK